jgi:hypothetical protein
VREHQKKESFYFLLLFSLWVKVRIGCIWALSLSGFLALLLSYTHLLIVDFLGVVSSSGCRLVKPNHLNLDVV